MTVATNRLGQETSPYLLQHQHNPVHWLPWSDEALALARATGKPILLSIGYAACHWCHVMAHESFEDPAIAAQMNDDFVNVKVDREERPDLDHIYQQALMMMGRRGGWPLTMFLTPDGEPFWGGTYFPPRAQGGRPGFGEMLTAVAEAWRGRAKAIEQNLVALRSGLAQLGETPPGAPISEALVKDVAALWLERLDPVHGGFGVAPKLPQTMALEFLWRRWRRGGDVAARDAVRLTLDHLAQGGVYDHLGGGFARYSTDDRWFAPHFEKMLYDNALLLALYVEVWLETGDDVFRQRIEQTIGWLARDMRTAEGGFAASLDADSEGEEGRFYCWSQAEIVAALGPDAEDFAAAYGVSAEGNWEPGRNILHRLAAPDWRGEAQEQALTAQRARLLALRAARKAPERDDKILADWNGLAIAAVAKAADVFSRPDWLALAVDAFAFIHGALSDADGRLRHSWRAGQSRPIALLDDYAAMTRAALALHEATGQHGFLDAARHWVETVETFYRDPRGGYFFTAADGEVLAARAKIAEDSATPSGNGLMAQNFARLFLLTGEETFRARAEGLIETFGGAIGAGKLGFSSLLNAWDDLRDGVQLVLVGFPEAEDLAALKRAALSVSRPGRSLVVVAPGSAAPGAPAFGKTMIDGRAAAYLCQGATCAAPILEPCALVDALRALNAPGRPPAPHA